MRLFILYYITFAKKTAIPLTSEAGNDCKLCVLIWYCDCKGCSKAFRSNTNCATNIMDNALTH